MIPAAAPRIQPTSLSAPKMCSTACLLHQRPQRGIMFFKSAHSSWRSLRSGHCQASDSDTLVIVAHNNIILQLGFQTSPPAWVSPLADARYMLMRAALGQTRKAGSHHLFRRVASEVLQVCQSNELLRHRKCGAVHPSFGQRSLRALGDFEAWTLFHLRHASITRVDVSSLGTKKAGIQCPS